VPGLPLGTQVSVPEHVMLGRVRDLLERDLLEQSVTERLGAAAFATAPPKPAGWIKRSAAATESEHVTG